MRAYLACLNAEQWSPSWRVKLQLRCLLSGSWLDNPNAALQYCLDPTRNWIPMNHSVFESIPFRILRWRQQCRTPTDHSGLNGPHLRANSQIQSLASGRLLAEDRLSVLWVIYRYTLTQTIHLFPLIKINFRFLFARLRNCATIRGVAPFEGRQSVTGVVHEQGSSCILHRIADRRSRLREPFECHSCQRLRICKPRVTGRSSAGQHPTHRCGHCG
jgi:hypothetical protein